MAHIRNFSLTNFKNFGNQQSFEFAPITILTGTNSSGKSNLIKAFLLLKNSSNDYLYLQALAFNSSRSLGDFEGSLNYKNSDSNQIIDFRLPLPLDYFEEQFFVELKFQKEERGLKMNGRLSSLEIFSWKENKKNTLFLFSALLSKEHRGGGEIYRSSITKEEVWKEDYDITVKTKYQINLDFIISLILSKQSQVIKRSEVGRTKEEIIDSLRESEEERKRIDLLGNHLKKLEANLEKLTNKHSSSKEEYEDFHKRKNTRKISLDLNQKKTFDLSHQDILSFEKNSPLFIYEIEGAGSIKLEDVQNVSSNEVLKEITEAEKSTLKKLLKTNLDLEEEAYEEMIKEYFFSDDFIAKFVIERIDSTLEKELEKRLSSDQCMKLSTLSTNGAFLIEKLFLKNIETAFKKLKDTFNVDYLGSIRGDQSRIYSSGGLSSFNDLIDDYIRLEINEDKVISKFLDYWLSYFNVGSKLSIETAVAGSVKALSVLRNGKAVNIADLGFGTSQIVPILLRIAVTACKNAELYSSTYKPSIICIEEAESDLHPALQSKLADLFIDAADKFNIQFIIETHSEYMIRKMQYWVAKKVIEPDAATIYYFYDPENTPEGEEQIKKINFREDGILDNDFGDGFYDEATRLTFELLKIQSLN